MNKTMYYTSVDIDILPIWTGKLGRNLKTLRINCQKKKDK